MGIPRVGFAINKFARQINVYISNGNRINGRWVESGSITTLQIIGDPQPTSGRMLEFLPEGTRLTDTKTIFTRAVVPIDNSQQNGGVNDVRFVWDLSSSNPDVYRLIETPQDWDSDYRTYLVELLRSNDAVPTV